MLPCVQPFCIYLAHECVRQTLCCILYKPTKETSCRQWYAGRFLLIDAVVLIVAVRRFLLDDLVVLIVVVRRFLLNDLVVLIVVAVVGHFGRSCGDISSNRKKKHP